MTSDTRPDIRVPHAPHLEGLRFRPVDLDRDLVPLVDLISMANLADRIEWLPTVETLRNDLEHRSNFDLARDTLVAEAADGELVGAIETNIGVRDGIALHSMETWVRPSHRVRGLERALLLWAEGRAREAAAEWPRDQPHELGTWVDDSESDAIALLEAEGYRQVRFGFMMVRSLADPIPDRPLPDGLEVRPVVESDHHRIWEADSEAFRDHYAPLERTEQDFLGWFSTPDLDTSLWRVAWAGDEIAGSVWNFVWPEENERLDVQRGWLEHISVRRPWRRRGLASALIVDSMRMLRGQGLTEAALGVDAENLSGALHLYESLGFRRHRTGISYRKAL
jgi:mycothiol synthase